MGLEGIKLIACDLDGTLLHPGEREPRSEAFELIDKLKGLGTQLALPRMQQRAVQIACNQFDSLKTHMLPPKPHINSKTDLDWSPLKAHLAHTRA